MRILLTGGTGFIGRELVHHLNQELLTVMSRNPHNAYPIVGHHIRIISNLDCLNDLNDFDAVINLAGEPIVNKRWSRHQKHIICSSRWNITEQLVALFKKSSEPPHTFISGSAVGIYGDHGNNIIDETSEPVQSSFAYNVCHQWESIAKQAENEKTRVCLLRTGIVLSKRGGALAKMLPSFQFAAGAILGSGNQYFPWIHIDDMIKGILFLLQHTEAKGAFNFTAPNPVTNREFSKTLASVLHRPCLFRAPEWMLELMLGEASCLLLESQKIHPVRLQEAGFRFSHSEIRSALKETLS
ncbi:TIGR01777 family oxidoreductase [Vibrio sp. SS-MA-C1-2]|uniref:TIGR01777 family oxidoreductase n=1 Tax=Vibrio sp. SS-MA-C1-2 TaxID=2908646 RepID=UPI001F412471|nr:TIGR01777 family oxidoreductase [Vibrio sp. SS-MA-C1-2]UJF18790.1 TIGR01777 family oxidoreductase [Vibrio sp. SS-MA-C1-2]